MEKEKQKDMTQDMSAEEKTEKKDGITEEAEEQCSCRKEESEAGGRNEKDDFCSCKKIALLLPAKSAAILMPKKQKMQRKLLEKIAAHVKKKGNRKKTRTNRNAICA